MRASLSTRRFLAAAFLLTIGCSESTAPIAFLQLDGLWDFTAVNVKPFLFTTCSDTGTFTLSKSDSTWVGTAQTVTTCRDTSIFFNNNSYSYRDFWNIRSGVATPTRFTFTSTRRTGWPMTGLCQDTAVADAGGQGNALTGTETCGNTRITWHAVRGAPIASITVAPNRLLTVMGDFPRLDAVLRTASGARVFSRPVAWSTDNAQVATVTGAVALTGAAGLVRPASVGSATITASAEGLSGMSNLTVLPPTNFGAITAGDAFTCALGADRRPYCWGLATFYLRGSIPIPVQGAPSFSTISGSQHHICAQTAANAVWCWGRNESGQLGNGSTIDADSPIAVSGSFQFAVASAGGRHTCGLTTVAALFCWGANGSGQLGNSSTAESHAPVAVSGGLTFNTVTRRRQA